MADLRDLLRDAAAPPTRRLDVSALLQQAGRPRRRWVAWLASLGAVFAIATPVGVQWAAGGDHAKVRTLPAPVSTTVSIPVSATLNDSGSGAAAADNPPADAASVTSDAGAPADHAASGADAAYPAGPGCSVDTTDLAPGASRTCRFTATDAGGWWAGYLRQDQTSPPIGVAFADPSADVQVTRAGVATHYLSGQYGSGCADAIIEPGDLVDVTLTAAPPSRTSTPPGHYEVGAGNHWRCGQQG